MHWCVYRICYQLNYLCSGFYVVSVIGFCCTRKKNYVDCLNISRWLIDTVDAFSCLPSILFTRLFASFQTTYNINLHNFFFFFFLQLFSVFVCDVFLYLDAVWLSKFLSSKRRQRKIYTLNRFIWNHLQFVTWFIYALMTLKWEFKRCSNKCDKKNYAWLSYRCAWLKNDTRLFEIHKYNTLKKMLNGKLSNKIEISTATKLNI